MKRHENMNLADYELQFLTSGPRNENGDPVGELGRTGVYCHHAIYRGCSIIPRPAGGCMVIVTSDLDVTPFDGCDELRYERIEDAIKDISNLKKSKKNDIPF